MKTKIIYISGNEVFDMTEIRAAFEEVRSALGLGNDTILFGVPVDSDNAIETTIDNHTAEQPVVEPEQDSVQENITKEPEHNTEYVECSEIDEISTSINNLELAEIIDTATEQEEEIIEAEIKEEPVATEIAIEMQPENTDMDTDAVIPILSVLSVKDDENTTDLTEEKATENEIVAKYDSENTSENEVIIEEQELATETIDQSEEIYDEKPVISSINIDSELIAPVADTDKTTTVSISDMINDDVPSKPVKKTLEQLLESMTPLREDHISDTNSVADPEDNFDDFSDDDTDATLAQLASEFVQTENTIPTPPKNETQGKIGKLKNILPFKKAKRDDSGLMGDLFGWAGVAANDDDFSIPGFFTKKQGA